MNDTEKEFDFYFHFWRFLFLMKLIINFLFYEERGKNLRSTHKVCFLLMKLIDNDSF